MSCIEFLHEQQVASESEATKEVNALFAGRYRKLESNIICIFILETLNLSSSASVLLIEGHSLTEIIHATSKYLLILWILSTVEQKIYS